jgi:hypothetical protein
MKPRVRLSPGRHFTIMRPDGWNLLVSFDDFESFDEAWRAAMVWWNGKSVSEGDHRQMVRGVA